MAPAPRRFKSPCLTFRPPTAHICALTLLSASTLFLSACGSFFSCEGKSDCPTTCVASSTVTCPTTGSSTVDYAYVANSTTSTTTIDAYNIGAGALTAVSGSPFNFDYSPVSMVVTPANTFLYAASDPNLSSGSIYGYSVGTGGALSDLSSSGAPQITENDAALAVSPDGNWLLTLPTAGLINVYSIASTGAAGGSTAYSYPLTNAPNGTLNPISLAVAPGGLYVAAALETGGANVFSFVTSTGGPISGQTGTLINPNSSSNGVYALAFDINNYLYCATTNGLVVFSVTNTSTASSPTVTALKTYTIGTSPRSIAIASTTTDSVTTPNYVYVGDEGTGKIYGFSIGTNAALTAISGSPFTGPTDVNSLAVDSTGKYLIASGYNTSTGIQLFSIGTTGALTSAATAGTGSNAIPGVIATTH